MKPRRALVLLAPVALSLAFAAPPAQAAVIYGAGNHADAEGKVTWSCYAYAYGTPATSMTIDHCDLYNYGVKVASSGPTTVPGDAAVDGPNTYSGAPGDYSVCWSATGRLATGGLVTGSGCN